MAFLVKEAELGKQAREAKLALKEKRKKASKLPVRDSLTLEQFESLLSLVKETTYKAARTRLAFILLYYTGLRVSNLLVLKVGHIDELYDNQETNVPLIKRGTSRHFISIGVQGQHLLGKYSKDILLLKQEKGTDDLFFTANPSVLKERPLKALDRSNFDKDLNSVLKRASALLGKYLRTHSFRATFVTDLLNVETPIHKVKEIIGHSDIKSTSTYQRSTITQKETRSIIASVNRSRKENFVIKVNKKRGHQQSKREKATSPEES